MDLSEGAVCKLCGNRITTGQLRLGLQPKTKKLDHFDEIEIKPNVDMEQVQKIRGVFGAKQIISPCANCQCNCIINMYDTTKQINK